MTLKFSPASHRYWLDGKPVPGVTTLLKGIPKPQLTYWAARTVAEYVADNPEAVDTLRAAGRAPMVAALKEAPWQRRDDAALRGTEVHALAEQLVQGHEVDVPERHLDLVQGYADWLDTTGAEALLVERAVANRKHWYAGTLDLVATIGDDTWLLDVKTSKGVYGEHACQVAAYAAAEIHLGDGGPDDEQPMPHIDRLGVLHVEDGITTLHEVDPARRDDAWRIFLHAAWVHRQMPQLDILFLQEKR